MANINVQTVATRRGGLDVLELREIERPRPGPGQALIKVEAAGVAFADVLIREGLYPGIGPYPRPLGYDFVGRVEALGPGVESPPVGARVAALTVTGAAATRIVWPAADLVRAPDHADPAEAVALVLNYVTAHQMMTRVAGLEPGAACLFHGGGGGVGAAFLKLARLQGIKVYATASAGKRPFVESLGGVAIDYASEDFVARLAAEAPGGVRAAFDPLGGASWKRSFSTLGLGGVLVCFGAQNAAPGGRARLTAMAGAALGQPRYTPLDLLSGSRTVAGYNIALRKEGRPDEFRADLAHLFSLLADQRLKPAIAARLPLSEVRRAHEMMGAHAAQGKIVLIPEGA